MAVLNYEGLSYLYSQLVAHFANQNDVKLLSDEVGQLEANLGQTFNTVKVGETSITGSSTTPLTLQGDNIILTPNADNKTITFSISDETIQGALEDFNFGIATESKEGLIKSGGDISIDANGIVSVKDNSHSHTIENVSGLSTKFAEITQHFDEVEGDIETINTTLATKQDQTQVQNLIDSAINQLVDGAPDALNTLNELAAALGDDKDYYQTINELINGIKNTLNTKANADELGAHVANKENPHEVTIVEEGEGNIVSSFENGAQIIAHKDAYGILKKEGNIVQENCLENMPIRVKTVLEPIQEGSGDPYPAGGGKNLCPGIEAGAYMASNGEAGDVEGYLRTKKIPVTEGVVYVQSDDLGAGFTDIHFWDANGAWLGYVTGGNINNRPAGTAFIGLNFYQRNVSWVQVELGSVATPYAPYSNIRSIAGRMGAVLTRSGKNLLGGFSGKTQAGITFTVNDDGSVHVSGTSTAQASVSVNVSLPKGRYVLSGCPVGGTSDNTSGGYALYTKIGSNYRWDTGSGVTFGLDTPAVLDFSIVIRANTTIDKTFYPQIEFGSTASAFEPYQGDTFTLNFGQTIYGGTLDWNKGEMMVDWAMLTLDGVNQKAHFMSIDTDFIQVRLGDILPDARKQAGNGNLICSHLPEQYGLVSIFPYPHVFLDVLETPYIRAYFSTTLAATVDKLNAYLAAQYVAGTPVQIAYKLAEPYTIQLSPNQIQSLKGTNIIYSESGFSSVIFNADALNYDSTPISVKQEGNLIQVKNGIDGYGFKATSIIEPIQNGSGEPYPAGGGRNLLKTGSTVSVNGITYTVNSDGTMIVNGTATAMAVFSLPYNKEVGETYTLTGCPAGGGNGKYLLQVPFGSNDIGDGATFIATEETTAQANIIVWEGQTVNNLIFKPMLVKGSTKYPYEPYSNIRPITGRTGTDLRRYGKNLLWNIVESRDAAAFHSNGDGVFVCKIISNYILPNPFLFKAGQTYTISLTRVSGTGNNPCIVVRNPSGDTTNQKHNYGDPDHPLTFSFDVDTEWNIMIQSASVNGDVTVGDSWAIQLELGSTATPFEPYQSDTFNLSFGETVYGGELDWNTGVLTVDRKGVVFDGSENWSANIVGDGTYRNQLYNIIYDNQKPINSSTYPALICSHYRAVPTDWIWLSYYGVGFEYNQNVIGFYDKQYNTSDISLWKAYLAAQKAAGTPLTVVYKLAEPYTIQLTPQHLTMLQGENNFYSNSSSLKVKSNTSIENYYTLDSFNLPAPEKIFTKESVIPIANGGTGAITKERALINLGLTATAAELNYVDGVTSNIQTQLNNKSEYYGSSVGDAQEAVFYSKICKILTPNSYSDLYLEFDLNGRADKHQKVKVWLQKNNTTALIGKSIYYSGPKGNAYNVVGYHYVDSTNGDYVEIWCKVPSWDTVNIQKKSVSGNFSNPSNSITWYNNSKNAALPTTSTTVIQCDATAEVWSGNISWNNITNKPTYYASKSLSYSDQLITDDAINAFNTANTLQAAVWHNTSSPGVNNGIIINAGWKDTSYGAQIAIDDDPTYYMALRQKGTTGWSAWKRIAMADGTGASGEWGININGTASKVSITKTNPSSGTTYMIPFMSSTGSQGLLGNDGIGYWTQEGTTTVNGTGELKLGNNVVSGVAGNKKGYIYMYGTSSGYTEIVPSNNTTSNIVVQLPSSSGTIALTSSNITGNAATATALTSGTIGSVNRPVYFLNGKPTLTTSLWAQSAVTTDEVQNGAGGAAGKIYFAVAGSNTGNRTIYTFNAANEGKSVITIDQNNNITLNGHATSATKDGDGNTITSYYMPKSGGKFHGDVIMKNSPNYPQIQFQPTFATDDKPFLAICGYTGSTGTSYTSTARAIFRVFSFTSGSTTVSSYY